MKITWLGHACFKLESKGYTAVIDPFEGVPGYYDINETANAVYASHSHYDHHYFDGVKIKETDAEPFTVDTVACFHDNEGGAKRGDNLIHIISDGEIKVVHAGDIGHVLNEDQLKKLKNCDVLLIPVGGYYTVGPDMAKEICDSIDAKVIIPMHFRFEDKGLREIDDSDSFITKFPSGLVKPYDGNSITVTKETEKQLVLFKCSVK